SPRRRAQRLIAPWVTPRRAAASVTPKALSATSRRVASSISSRVTTHMLERSHTRSRRLGPPMVSSRERGQPMTNSDEFVQLKPRGEQVDAVLEPELLEIVEKIAATSRSPISASSGGGDWDAPFDLRVARP